MKKTQSYIYRVNTAILSSADNLAANLVILIGVYIVAELHNYQALADFALVAGVPYGLHYLTPLMLGVFVLAVYWSLIAYKAKGYATWPLWAVVWLFVIASATLNIMHYGTRPDQIAMSLLGPSLILFGGWLAKDIVSRQVKEERLIRTVESLNQDAHDARQELHKIQEEAAQAKTEKTAIAVSIEASRAELDSIKAEIEQQREELKHSIKTTSLVPDDLREAIQVDALLAAGLTQSQAANIVGIHRNTAAARLSLVNGSGLHKGD